MTSFASVNAGVLKLFLLFVDAPPEGYRCLFATPGSAHGGAWKRFVDAAQIHGLCIPWRQSGSVYHPWYPMRIFRSHSRQSQTPCESGLPATPFAVHVPD